MSAADHYAYRVNWSRDDEEYVATCAEFPSLSVLEPDANQALDGIRDLVAFVIADLQAEGEPVPQPYAERKYSGKVLVRMSSDLHRDLITDAEEKNVSLNHLIVERLARSTTTADKREFDMEAYRETATKVKDRRKAKTKSQTKVN